MPFVSFNYFFLDIDIRHSYSFTKFSRATETLYIHTYIHIYTHIYIIGGWSLSNQLFSSSTAYNNYFAYWLVVTKTIIYVAEWWVAIFYSNKKINLHHSCTNATHFGYATGYLDISCSKLMVDVFCFAYFDTMFMFMFQPKDSWIVVWKNASSDLVLWDCTQNVYTLIFKTTVLSCLFIFVTDTQDTLEE